MMNILLRRIYTFGEITEGRLSIEGCSICDTLENSDACLPVGSYPLTLIKCKLYARQMICVGQPPTDLFRPTKEPAKGPAKGFAQAQAEEPAKASVAACATCGRLDFAGGNTRLPLFCPQIKAGNGIHNRLDGSILVGSLTDPDDPTRICHGCLIHPQAIFDNLFDRIRMSLNRGHDVSLLIRE